MEWLAVAYSMRTHHGNEIDYHRQQLANANQIVTKAICHVMQEVHSVVPDD
jgi:hypothetical protein